MYIVTSYNAYKLKTEHVKTFNNFEEAEEYAKSIFKAFHKELDHYDFNVVVETENVTIVYEPAVTKINKLQREILYFLNNKTEEEQQNFKVFLEEIEFELHEIKLNLINFYK